MHTGALKKWALALTFWLALHTSALRAQIFTNDLPLQANTTGTDPVDFEFRADGTLIGKGNFGVGSLLTADQGSGTRLLWFPSLAAFRAGGVNGTQWDAGNIGQFSAALGWNTTASGYYSLSLGAEGTASGYASIAIGLANSATERSATAIGSYNSASGLSSTALGASNAASNWNAIALGSWNTSIGHASVAMGGGNTASGWYSTASGLYTTASAYASFVVGMYNVGGGTLNSWVPTEPLFEIGNGTASTPSDALIVYKNGNAALQGTLQVAPGGDIPMYSGE